MLISLVFGLNDLTVAQEPTSTDARIDIVCRQGRLHDPALSPGYGVTYRMDWIEETRRDGSLVAEVPVVCFGETRHQLQFVPDSDGPIDVDFRGPYLLDQTGARQMIQVEFLAIEIGGAEVIQQTELPGLVWHDEPLHWELRGAAGQAIRIKVVAKYRPKTMPHPHPANPQNDPAFQLARQFSKGVNLANALEVPPGEDWGDNTYTVEDFAAIQAEGFDHVRIPVGWHHHCGPAPDYRISDLYLRQVDEQIDLATTHQLAVVINVHHFNDFTQTPEKNWEKLKRIWLQIADRYRNRPLSVAWEILNEPHGAATTEIMNRFYNELLTELRRLDHERLIIVSPGNWGLAAEIHHLNLPENDRRLLVTIHSYSPHNFTYQGAPWEDQVQWLKGIEFPGPPANPISIPGNVASDIQNWVDRYNRLDREMNPCNSSMVEFELKLASDWSRYFGRPIYLGEFGAFTGADLASRARYYRMVRETAEGLGIGWSIWDWKASFVYWDRRTKAPLPGLHEALFR